MFCQVLDQAPEEESRPAAPAPGQAQDNDEDKKPFILGEEWVTHWFLGDTWFCA